MWWWQSTTTAQMKLQEEKQSTMEQDMIQQFRNNVSKLLTASYTDAILLKWLRCGNYDLAKCEALLREYLSMTAVYEIDKLLEFYKKPEVLENYDFASFLGIAKDGSPVTYFAAGRADFYATDIMYSEHTHFSTGLGEAYIPSIYLKRVALPSVIASVNGFDLGKYASFKLESDLKRAREQSKKLGKEINEITYILDMDGFSIRTAAHQCTIEMAFDMFRMLQDYYPEIWKNSLIINASPIFYKAFNFFKPILRGNLLQNLKVASKETTPELLLKYIDEDVLPAFLGGKKVDSKGDPMCREFLKFGGVVPDKFYAMHRPLLYPSDPGMENILVRTRSCYNHSLVVREANSRLRIQMRSEGGSIATTILLREFGPDPNHLDLPPSDVFLDENDEKCNVRLISPCVKLQIHLAQADDINCRAPWPGIYIFRFDNTGNWISARRIIFRLEVIPPKS